MYSTLITAQQVHDQRDASWVLLDCRHDLAKPEAGLAAYGQSHIPGALFAHLDRDLSTAKTGMNGRHPLPTKDVFAEFLRRCGVNADSQIVAYDATGGMFAARLWWMARWIGHAAVAVLDGGLPAWTAAGYALDSTLPAASEGTITPGLPLALLATKSDVEKNLVERQKLVLDARAPERYRGETEPLDRVAGHIPGAQNRFYQRNLSETGHFKPAATLREEFSTLVAENGGRAVIHQCGSGATACHNLLAMEFAGLSGSALYAGSWSEWSADENAPVATGA